jgi:Common central domain of tyrosinase/Polyphenol oxidase middle domain
MGPTGPATGAGAIAVRRSINSLDPAGPQIAALRRGVAELRRRSAADPRDPTGWTFQANIHGTYDAPLLPVWGQCQHGSFFFLSWHRMYVYWFERILRAAAGESTLALPYWNWSDPAQRALPAVFRRPANATNPLYERRRASGINQGFQLAPSDVSFATAFGFLNFAAQPGSGLSFGGQQAPAPGHFLSPHGQLESQPHDVIHDKLGGPTGLMGDPNTAARDPIFWLHHANIDRLWKRWLDRGGGRADPTAGPWLSTPFAFVDERGRGVRLTAGDILDTAGQLQYRYDDDPPPVAALRFAEEPLPAAVAAAAAGRRARPVAASASRGVIELGAEPVSVDVPMPGAAHRELAAAAAPGAPPARVVLTLEGIRFGRNPGVSYEVYLGLPPDATPGADAGAEADFRSPYYVGNLGFFGLQPHQHGEHAGGRPAAGPGGHQEHGGQGEGEAPVARRSFDVTANVRALQERGEWPDAGGAPLRVTLVMRGLLPPAGRRAVSSRPARPGSRVTIDRVVIATE